MNTLTLKKYKSAKAWVKAEYPELFTRPMAIGMQKELIKAKPVYIEKKQISKLLYNESRKKSYLRALTENSTRYHLDGSVMGVVPEKHKLRAQDILSEAENE